MNRSGNSLIWAVAILFVGIIALAFLIPEPVVETGKESGSTGPLSPQAEKASEVPKREESKDLEDPGKEIPEETAEEGEEVPENLPLQNWIDGHVQSASFVAFYGDNPEPVLEVVSPNGRVIKREHVGSSSDVEYLHEPATRIKSISITEPEPGRWQVLLNGRPHLPNDTYSVSYVMDVENELNVDMKLRYVSGNGVAFVFTASLDDSKIPVDGVKLSSYYYLDDGKAPGRSAGLAFNDAGRGNDQVAGDKVFTSERWRASQLGQYELVVVMHGWMEGHRFIRQAVDFIPHFYDLASVPMLEPGKTYQIVTEGERGVAVHYNMRVLGVSRQGEVVVEKSGGIYADRPGPIREPFNFDMLFEGVKIRVAGEKESPPGTRETERPTRPTADPMRSPTDSGYKRDWEAQKRTVTDIGHTGTAMYSWLTDQVGAGAAGQSQTYKPNAMVALDNYHLISHGDLTKILVPQYMQVVPETDGWGHPYEFHLDVADLVASQVMCIRSPGRDGRFSSRKYEVNRFAPNNFDEDIVWADGYFVRRPKAE